ncbi:type II toxin-antitoxin system prevent-host-death family antitoxin [Larkinella terrae]|uniref:Type II toxin-antitoxin system prevent-host-death family antitoxin n=1 Tax=Larkinella terrae TaxID=2025311 RepID=A0A7K0EVL1_9BACT|nr:type II toxin-antitoxin system prevent-host-death family antitoxin [Larkinella terrae]MRS65792.1 type II toxin-antitoxin system prevent-host-death family antitoxin [Larkinella terrae]
MALQYLSDSNGKPTAVVIPIQDWEMLKKKHEDLSELEEIVPAKKQKPSDFRGSISKKMAREMNQYVEKSKQEWDRDIF